MSTRRNPWKVSDRKTLIDRSRDDDFSALLPESPGSLDPGLYGRRDQRRPKTRFAFRLAVIRPSWSKSVAITLSMVQPFTLRYYEK